MTSNSVNSARVKLSIPMGIGIVLSVGLGYLLIHVFTTASRTIGWIVFSGVIALMLYPALNLLNRFMPRPLGVMLLCLFVISLIAIPSYTVVDNVNRQTHKLNQSLPARIHELENKGRFAQNLKKFGLERKTREAIKTIPETLQGGTREQQIRANANRAIAFIAGGVLMIFFLLYGQRLVEGALSNIHDDDRKTAIKKMLFRAYSKTTAFGWSQIALSITAGLTTYIACRLVNIPAAGLLGVWVGLWSLVPIFGMVIGSIPAILLAGSVSVKSAIGILVFFIAYEIIESYIHHRILGPRTLRVDSIVTILVIFGGIELYGLGGGLAGLVIATFTHALAGEIASTNPV